MNQSKWAKRYDRLDYLFGTAPSRGLVNMLPFLHPGGRTLAIADGEGRNSVFLAEKGMEVVAMDCVEIALKKARRLAATKEVKVDFRHGDILSWDWEEDFYDNIVGVFIQFSPPDERALVFKGIDMGLRSGGRVLLHGYTPKQIEYGTGGPSEPEQMYTEALLSEAFSGYKILHCSEYESEIFEGTGHRGQSALIDFVAEKP